MPFKKYRFLREKSKFHQDNNNVKIFKKAIIFNKKRR